MPVTQAPFPSDLMTNRYRRRKLMRTGRDKRTSAIGMQKKNCVFILES